MKRLFLEHLMFGFVNLSADIACVLFLIKKLQISATFLNGPSSKGKPVVSEMDDFLKNFRRGGGHF